MPAVVRSKLCLRIHHLTRTIAVATLIPLIGILVALFADGADPVPLISFAQTMTVLGGPVLAFSMPYLVTRRPTDDTPRAFAWIERLHG